MDVAKCHLNGNGAETEAQGGAVLIGIVEPHASSGADHLTGSIRPEIRVENLDAKPQHEKPPRPRRPPRDRQSLPRGDRITRTLDRKKDRAMTADPEKTISAPNGKPPATNEGAATDEAFIRMTMLSCADGGEAEKLTPILALYMNPKQIAVLLRVSDAGEGGITVRRVGVSEEGLPRFLVTAVRRKRSS